MEIDLSPLKLSKQGEEAFCRKRIKEQRDYIDNLVLSNRGGKRLHELIVDADLVKEMFLRYLKTLL